MSGLSKLLKALFNAPEQAQDRERSGPPQASQHQQESLILARYDGACNAFAKMEERLSGEFKPTGFFPVAESSSTPLSYNRRAGVFYALAKARMLLAEQLYAAFQEDLQQRGQGWNKISQAGIDLAILTDQIEVLTRAAVMEATQPEATEGKWAAANNLGLALNPNRTEDGSEEDSLAHLKAIYNGGLVLFTKLRAELEAKEAMPAPGAATAAGSDQTLAARLLMAEAETIYERLSPLVSRLQVSPELFASEDSLLHAELERQVNELIRRLEGVAAELALPNVTRTPLWQSLVAAPPPVSRAGTSGLSRGARDYPGRSTQPRPWQRDIWCMTSKLFKKDYYTQDRANQVLSSMWQRDPDPEQTWRLYRSVMEMEQSGKVDKQGSYYNACPWTDIWRAKEPVRVGDRYISRGVDFCLHIEAEPDGRFSRKVITGDFRPTEEIDYCDNEDERGHHDDDD